MHEARGGNGSLSDDRPLAQSVFSFRQAPRMPTYEGAASRAGPTGPDPQSQSFSRSYGSNLPTSLTYINLSTRGSTPRRPAADSVRADPMPRDLYDPFLLSPLPPLVSGCAISLSLTLHLMAGCPASFKSLDTGLKKARPTQARRMGGRPTKPDHFRRV